MMTVLPILKNSVFSFRQLHVDFTCINTRPLVQKLLGCTSAELDALRTQARRAAEHLAPKQTNRASLSSPPKTNPSDLASPSKPLPALPPEAAAADREAAACMPSPLPQKTFQQSPEPSPLPQKTFDFFVPSPIPQKSFSTSVPPPMRGNQGINPGPNARGDKNVHLFARELDLDIDTAVPGVQLSGVRDYVFGDGERPISSVRSRTLSPVSLQVHSATPESEKYVRHAVQISRGKSGIEGSLTLVEDSSVRVPAKDPSLAHAGEDALVHRALSKKISEIEETTRNLEILPDVGALAVKLVGESRLEVARFQDEALAKHAQLRKLEDKVSKADGAVDVLRVTQEHLTQAQVRSLSLLMLSFVAKTPDKNYFF
jgi:hypothetical protein